MISFPNAKINIGLNILGKREDGYHDLETVYYPLPFYDAVEVIIDQSVVQPRGYRFSQSGNALDSGEENNLCIRAFHLLKKDFPSIPPLRIHLHKCIPSGAGLGGGSADAAFMLKTMNRLLGLDCTDGILSAYAARLGSDCPFFIENKPCLARGRGEILMPVDLDLSAYKIVLVNPGIQINTTDMFGKLDSRIPRTSRIEKTLRLPVEKWKEQISNDFEEIVFTIYPAIAKIKSDLYAAGAVYASLSGSGSSVYGIFHKNPVRKFDFPEAYLVKSW
jgi:4-diphosphocytidyl-2-C-methyl-D-erythritol kinase